MKYAFVKNKFTTINKATISIKERGFRFGDGIFETIRIKDYQLTDFKLHLNRLESGLSAVKINYDIAKIAALAHILIIKNKQREGFLRISVSRGIGSLGYLPVDCVASLIIETENLRKSKNDKAVLLVSPYQKISIHALPVNYKLMQGLNSTLALMEAKEHNADDAILLNEHKHITETTTSNIFMVINGKVFTPKLTDGLLGGVLREKIINNFSVTEQSFSLTQLKEVDNIFITNSSIRLKIVTKIIDQEQKILWQFKDNKLSDAVIDELKEFLS